MISVISRHQKNGSKQNPKKVEEENNENKNSNYEIENKNIKRKINKSKNGFIMKTSG